MSDALARVDRKIPTGQEIRQICPSCEKRIRKTLLGRKIFRRICEKSNCDVAETRTDFSRRLFLADFSRRFFSQIISSLFPPCLFGGRGGRGGGRGRGADRCRHWRAVHPVEALAVGFTAIGEQESTRGTRENQVRESDFDSVELARQEKTDSCEMCGVIIYIR